MLSQEQALEAAGRLQAVASDPELLAVVQVGAIATALADRTFQNSDYTIKLGVRILNLVSNNVQGFSALDGSEQNFALRLATESLYPSA
ncbi:hypothetical protein A3A66_02470 [Microgenomates group bacterium RIFCSPLOWO2_01_FULL_46_13]|nr:MAG: hypothetical protein A2783_03275 [Microgenomates group bacterium RIFCSPHIGHO2_01_FULL_45_11]OGV94835.1 MAG: hypothetical protein A3A66_02470 [Microgenomates group bacterium RIFCSPLOWO2_01_FULL_46_13]